MRINFGAEHFGPWCQRERNKMGINEPAQALRREEGETLWECGLSLPPLMMYSFLITKAA